MPSAAAPTDASRMNCTPAHREPNLVEIELHETRPARLRHLAEALDAHALLEEATITTIDITR